MILIINLSTKFSTPQTPLRLTQNVLVFQVKRTCVLIKTSKRFPVNVKAFSEGEKNHC